MNYGKDTPTQEGRAETLLCHSIWFSSEEEAPEWLPTGVELLARCPVRGQDTRTDRVVVEPVPALAL